jgi:hypothetical protein
VLLSCKEGYKVSVVTTSLPGVTTYETYNGNLNVIPIDGTIPGSIAHNGGEIQRGIFTSFQVKIS